MLKERSAAKILFIDHKIPSPDRDSGSFRILQILEILSSRYNLVFWPDSISEHISYIAALENMGIEVIAPPQKGSFLSSYGPYFDLVIISRPNILEKYLKIVKSSCLNAKIIFDTVDLHYIRLRRQAELTERITDKMLLSEKAHNYHEIETSGMMQADQTWVVALEEQQALFLEHPHADIRIVPNIHPLPLIQERGFGDTTDVLFVGSFTHHPNTDAVLYCAENIWPEIIRQIPSAKMIIIGSDPPPDVRALSSSSIIIKGYVPNIEPELIKSRVFLAPLRYGAGMKGKLGQALSYGIPAVTTTIGAEGFSFTGNELVIADSPSEMIRAVVSLYTDQRLWEGYHRRGRAFMERFTPDAIGASIHSSIQYLLKK